MKNLNWKCLGEKASGIICNLRDKCERHRYMLYDNNKFIVADFNKENTVCENFIEFKNDLPTVDAKKKKELKI